ncbi:MAG: Flp family type IVb pilin [Bryobacteraceae bacterium]
MKSRLWKNTTGQDLIEFAIMAGFAAVAANALLPGLADRVQSVLNSVVVVLCGTPTGGIS